MWNVLKIVVIRTAEKHGILVLDVEHSNYLPHTRGMLVQFEVGQGGGKERRRRCHCCQWRGHQEEGLSGDLCCLLLLLLLTIRYLPFRRRRMGRLCCRRHRNCRPRHHPRHHPHPWPEGAALIRPLRPRAFPLTRSSPTSGRLRLPAIVFIVIVVIIIVVLLSPSGKSSHILLSILILLLSLFNNF